MLSGAQGWVCKPSHASRPFSVLVELDTSQREVAQLISQSTRESSRLRTLATTCRRNNLPSRGGNDRTVIVDIEIDGLVRGVGCVALAANCLEWTMGYLVHAMRGWDDATFNAALGQPGRVWQEFDRLAQELCVLLGADMTELREDVKQLRDERNQLVHSVWMQTNGLPGVPDSYEIWHPRTETTQPVTADRLMDLAQRVGRTATDVQALTTALLELSKERQES